MYMTLMALLMVPRGIFRALVWLVMTVVGWMLAAAESVYAQASYQWNSFNGELTVNGDSTGETISVGVDGDSVIVDVDGSTTVVLDGNNDSIHRDDVRKIAINGNGGDDSLYGAAINDTDFPNLNPSDCVVMAGNDGADTIVGSPQKDTLLGGSGQDLLDGAAGGDSLQGDGGNDTLFAGTTPLGGREFLKGGSGNDSLVGSIEDDCVFGGDGDDTIWGYAGVDDLIGGSGADFISGGAGDDFVHHGDEGQTTSDGYIDTLEGGSHDTQAGDEVWFSTVDGDSETGFETKNS